MSIAHSPESVTPLTNGGRVRFMPLRMENIHTHFQWNNDPELNRLDSELPHEEESFGAFKQRFERLSAEASASQRHFEIHDQVHDTLIGVAYVARISEHHNHGLVGITIGEREYWGQGYGKESLALLLEYCFGVLDLHRVSAETFEYNTAWRDLVKGMGFAQEGTVREYLYRDEQYWDKEIYSILEQEYRRMQSDAPGRRSTEAAVESP